MTASWELSFTVDAHGHEQARVWTLPIVGSPSRQLVVRVGRVTVGCLDGASAMSAGMAWATARWQTREWLPEAPEEPWRARLVPDTPYGGAYPAGSILLDGRQPWQVTPEGMALRVTVGPLQVVVHDLTALDTHVRAWTEASAMAARLFPGKAMPFNRLVDQARKDHYREIDATRDRERSRRRLPVRGGEGHSRA
jgi:hypothetical protein